MTLILRKCNKDGSSSYGFKYGKVGERVTCPDWDPNPKCGNGLHGLKEGNGEWNLLDGDDWLIIDADDQIIDIDKDKCKFNTGIILFRGTAEELKNSEYPNKFNLNSESASCWAKHIGNRDIMMHKIVDSQYAIYWVHAYGNKDIMINKINNSEDAYYWAREFGDVDVMKPKVTEKYWIERWNNNFIKNKIKV